MGVESTGRPETTIWGGLLPVFKETVQVVCVQVVTVVTGMVCKINIRNMKTCEKDDKILK